MSEIVSREMLTKYLQNREVAAGSIEDLVRMGINEGIDTHCNRIIVGDTYTEEIFIKDCYTCKIFLANPPIRNFTSFSNTLDSSLIDAASYHVDPDTGAISFIGGGYFLQWASYTAVYDGGYDPIPADLQLVCMSIMAREIQKSIQGRHGMRTKQFTQGSTEHFPLDLEPTEKLFLEKYTLKRFC